MVMVVARLEAAPAARMQLLCCTWRLEPWAPVAKLYGLEKRLTPQSAGPPVVVIDQWRLIASIAKCGPHVDHASISKFIRTRTVHNSTGLLVFTSTSNADTE
jgi:hypothetical protein